MNKEAQRELLYSLLGDLPERHRAVSFEMIADQDLPHFRLQTLKLELNGIEPVPAYLALPKHKPGPYPLIMYHHAHGGHYDIGKEEILSGRKALVDPPYAEVLTNQGYAVFCMDMWGFGERKGRTESQIFKQMLWQGQVMWGMMMYDSLRALDVLMKRDDIDASRIAAMGISMGSTMAWWMAALDTRIKVCIDLCCLTDFESLIQRNGLDGHGIYYYVPGLLKHFSTAQINALIAPRAHLSLQGLYDPLTPSEGLQRIDEEVAEAYRQEDALGQWQLIQYPIGHYETREMRQAVLHFLKEKLLGDRGENLG